MNNELYELAQEVRALYRAGFISREEAKKRIKPYQEHFDKVSKEKAKKYNMRPMKFNFIAFMR